MAARALVELERHILLAGGTSFVDSFDLFVGTSTGSIIAAGLASSADSLGKFASPSKIERIYFEKGPKIFPKDWCARNCARLARNPFDWMGPKYRHDGLNAVLKEAFGDVTLENLPRNFAATYYKMNHPPDAVTAFGGPIYKAAGLGAFGSARLRDIVEASASAPTYFDPKVLQNGDVAADGGLFANNPSFIAYSEGKRLMKLRPRELLQAAPDDMTLVSIGCGDQVPEYARYESWGPFEWASPAHGIPLLSAVMHGESDSTRRVMSDLLKGDYHRFDVALPRGFAGGLDTTDPAILRQMVDIVSTQLRTPESMAALRTAASSLVRGAVDPRP